MSEDTIVVVFTDGIIDVVTGNHVVIQCTDDLDVFPLLFVDIVLDGFVIEAVPELQELDDVLSSLFEDYESIY